MIHLPLNVKGKVHPRTVQERPEAEKRYSSTLDLTSALDEGWVVNDTSRPLYPRERPGNHCTGGLSGSITGVLAETILQRVSKHRGVLYTKFVASHLT